ESSSSGDVEQTAARGVLVIFVQASAGLVERFEKIELRTCELSLLRIAIDVIVQQLIIKADVVQQSVIRLVTAEGVDTRVIHPLPQIARHANHLSNGIARIFQPGPALRVASSPVVR